ncbi:terminase gpA endonuclease subunit [Oceanibaculum indicum]|uniref:Phage terminase large subunit n=1 Tax=Oceanibaculum indicum P24 TaxID=1207063 RepID=K2JJZ4_9PROT|nr:terminase gpA endonuclease subunit [Oceanibaculum indicum]EKE70884.1 phage terminase large subunit [Oceanibaculum indicum P24]
MLRSDPLPDWRSGRSLVSRAISAAIRPPVAVTVAEAAERHRWLAKPGSKTRWRNATTPYLVEPMEDVLSRSVGMSVLMGPSQFGKTEVLLNVIGHAVKYRPSDILLLQPDKQLAIDFGERRLEREMIEPSPDYRAELGPSRSDDKQLEKTFRSGMKVTLIWPVKGQLASRSVKIVIVDERDRIDDDIGGEGDPVELLGRRTTYFGKDGKVLVASSPGRADGSGILALWRRGDQRLLAVPCRECGEYWTPGFGEDRKPTLSHLYRPEGCDEETARREARLVCPNCGGLHGDRDKPALLARGVWCPVGMNVAADGTLSGPRPEGRVRSRWFHGFLNPFKPLGDLAADLTAAEELFARSGDETALQTVHNTVLGIPYRAAADGAEPLVADDFDDRRDAYALRTVPAGVAYLVATVDVQGNRFAVLVRGFAADGESWAIDRFDITAPARGEGDIRPAERSEDWQELLPRVVRRVYPLADRPGWGMPVAVTVIDTGGMDGVSDKAREFWMFARRKRVPAFQLMMIKGATLTTAPMVGRPTYATVDGKPNKRAYHWWMLGTHELKNTLFNRLHRLEPGPGALHFPAAWEKRWFEELTAEEKRKGRWERIRRANESWDLEVYALAASLRLAPERIDWSNPPAWARPVEIDTARAKSGEGAGTVPAADGASAPSAPPAVGAEGETVVRAMPVPAGRVRRKRGVRGRVQ